MTTYAAVLAAWLAAASPYASPPVTDSYVANCMSSALADNGLTEASARRVQVNASVVVNGERMTFAAGDSVWSVCERSLNSLRMRYQQVERDARHVEELSRLYRRLAQLTDEIRARHERSRRIMSWFSLRDWLNWLS